MYKNIIPKDSSLVDLRMINIFQKIYMREYITEFQLEYGLIKMEPITSFHILNILTHFVMADKNQKNM